MNVIVAKWVFKNKLDEQRFIVRNNARLVAKDIIKKKELIIMKSIHLLLH